MKLSERAKTYIPPVFDANIADLKQVDIIDIDIVEEERVNAKGETYRAEFIEVDGIKYRVPKTVLENIHAILSAMPDLKYIRVLKQGSGKDSSYTTIPLTAKDENKSA